MRRRDMFALPTFALGLALPEMAQAAVRQRTGVAKLYSVLDYGAKADSKTMNTKSIQQAIDIRMRARSALKFERTAQIAESL